MRLRSQTAKLRAIVRLLFVVLKLSGFTWEHFRVPNGASKLQLLNSIGSAATVIPLRAILAFLRLSHSRYHAWNQAETCGLNDRNSCPRTTPSRLTIGEIDTIRELVMAKEYRHLNTGALARLAQRLGKVFASPTSWYRMVRLHAWKRPRNRIYPPKPKVGIRAAKPNEIWHIDTSIVRLLDGRRVYQRPHRNTKPTQKAQIKSKSKSGNSKFDRQNSDVQLKATVGPYAWHQQD